jgi:hypothetical protein
MAQLFVLMSRFVCHPATETRVRPPQIRLTQIKLLQASAKNDSCGELIHSFPQCLQKFIGGFANE